MPTIIGLTGGIASGKSTVAKMIKEKGIPIVDADVVAREVVEIGTDTYKRMVQEFGNDILHSDNTLNRSKLGSIIFQNKEKRETLNSIMHPAIRQRMKEQTASYVEKGYQAVVMDIPLLFESNLTHLVEKILLVFVNEEKQLERLMNRNDLTEKEALDRINSQMPLIEKVKMAHGVIDNNGSIHHTEKQLHQILQDWHIQI